MKNLLSCLLLLMLLITGCKNKPEKSEVPAANFFPVNDYLKGQLARLDTSLATFTKIETEAGVSDTVLIKNSEVKLFAKDFLTLPDITSPALKDDYDIQHLYDEAQEAFIFTFTTKEDHPVKSEHVILEQELNAEGKNNIRSIFVDLWPAAGSTGERKGLFWEADKGFQVVTTTPQAGGEVVKKLRVTWNGFDGQMK